GNVVAAGNGFPASASFTQALWGFDHLATGQAQELGISTSLLNLAGGGHFAAIGTQLSDSSRIAFSFSKTKEIDQFSIESAWATPDATAFSAGISTNLTPKWSVATTFSSLNEKNGLLGTTYSLNSPVHFGDDNNSMSVGIASSYDLG